MKVGLYLLQRLIAIIPTFFGICLMTFLLIHLVPGGPIERKVLELTFNQDSADVQSLSYQERGPTVSEKLIQELRKQYHLDKPFHERFYMWMKEALQGDFGKSFVYHRKVSTLIWEKFKTTLPFGLSSLIITYLICIPLGVRKAMGHKTKFDRMTDWPLLIFYSLPPVILGVLLIVFFATENFLNLFPLGGEVSDGHALLNQWEKILDRIYHMILPLVCYITGHFASITLLTKNALLEQRKKIYALSVLSRGIEIKKLYYKHLLKNALIPIVTDLGKFVAIFFSGSILIENIFQIDGIGLLSYQSVIARDYNVILGLVMMKSLIVMLTYLLSDLLYLYIDPKIDFA